MPRPIRALPFCAVVLAACSASATSPDLTGGWGGAEASLTLRSSGGTVAYPCGAGTIDAGWTVGAAGRFLATGKHYFGGGPVPPTGYPAQAARYEGRFMGASLEFSVILPELGDTVGPFHLVRGGPEVVEQCL